MHEYSMVQALLTRVEAEARARGATRIHRIAVRVGELAGVDAGLFETAFDTFCKGSICEGALLAVERVEARWECPSCSSAIPRGEVLRCAACDRPARLVPEGGEIVLQRIEMEVP